ncbi:MAG: CRTAC1 family protein, partial [Planctomycetes bacterium]|nr:CRTAC1 family protein [Planctomycetota bacterium]
MTRWRWILLLVAAIAAALTARWAWLEHAAQGFPKRRDAAAPATVVVEPLARRPDDNGPQNAGAARFVRLPASATHVEFTNLLRKENCYQYLTNGAGCAAGDYDGDGLVDLYLVSQDGENRLYRQTAPLVFEDVTRSAGGLGGGDAWGTGASFADVDGDGDLDLYVCNLEARNLLYENQGDGTFRENAAKFGLDIAAASMMCAFCDYDRDGSLDLYLLTNRALHAGWAQTPPVLDGFTPGKDTLRSPRAMVPTLEQAAGIGDLLRQGALTDANIPAELREHYFAFRGRHYMTGQQDRLLRNVGGRFVDVSSSAGIAGHGMGLSASWCDYDGDGWPDLYVCDDLESPDKLYQNQRDGTFRNVTADVVPHTAYYGMGSDWGDVDGDGSMDLIVADMSMTTHEKAKVLMGDMDNQRPVLMHWQPPQYMRNALLVNTGLGRFQEAGKLAGVASTDWTWSVLFGDLDNDARLDLLATNGIARFDTDPDLALAVDDLWQKQRYEAAYQLIQNVRRVPEQNLAFRNTGDLAFQRASDWGLELEAVTHGALLVDLDGDGDLDVVLNNWNEPAAIYENRTDDGRGVIVRLRGQQSERFGIGARVTLELDDGTELVRENWLSRGYLSGQCPELHFGVGSHRVAALTVRWPSGHVQRHSEAFDAPARVTCTEPPGSPAQRDAGVSPPTATLFRPAAAAPARHVENDFDEYVAQPLLPEEVGKLGPGLAFGDGGSLLFVGGARGRAGSLWRDAGNGDWREVKGPWQQDARCEDLAVLFFDADGDGDED